MAFTHSKSKLNSYHLCLIAELDMESMNSYGHSYVEIFGTVTSLHATGTRTLLDVDDCSGKMGCVLFNNEKYQPSQEEISVETVSRIDCKLVDIVEELEKHKQRKLKVGDMVHVRGRVNVYKGHPQVIVNDLRIMKCINELPEMILLVIKRRKEEENEKKRKEMIAQEMEFLENQKDESFDWDEEWQKPEESNAKEAPSVAVTVPSYPETDPKLVEELRRISLRNVVR